LDIQVEAIDKVIKKTVQVLEKSKYQIFEICENAQSERDSLHNELLAVKVELEQIIAKVDKLENHYRLSRIRLTEVSRDFNRFKEEDIRKAYEAATNLQMELSISREKEANLLLRLRKAAATIGDPDLARTYKDYLVGAFYQSVRPSEQERKQAHRTLYRDRRAKRAAQIMDVTPEGRASALTLSRAPKPILSAIVEGLISNPSLIQERAELLATQSLGDVGLDRLVSDLVMLTYDAEGIGEPMIRARLSAMGHEETLRRIDRTAAISHAPFLAAGASLDDVRRWLTKAIEVLLDALALTRALDELKRDDHFDARAFSEMKAQRDQVDRYLTGGTLWAEERATVH